LVFAFVVVAAVAVVYVDVRESRDARHNAERHARFAATIAAKQLGDALVLARQSVVQLAANPQIGQVILHPSGCTLSFDLGGLGTGHLDLLRSDGVVVCSSRPLPHGRPFTGYVGQGWVDRARAAQVSSAPTFDAMTNSQVVRIAVPISAGGGIVVGSLDLAPLARNLAALYAGGDPDEFLVTSRDLHAVLSRSINPARSVGTSLAGTSFSRAGGPLPHADLDGTGRLYAESTVPGFGWHLFVGEDAGAALAAAHQLQRRQLEIILIGLLAVFVATLLVYRRVARPMTDLAAAVRSSTAEALPVPVPVSGPTEVTALGEDVNALIASVNREFRKREQSEHHVRELAAIVESSADAIIGKSLDGTITSWNAAAERIYGYSASDAVGQSIEMLEPEGRHGEVRSILRRLEAGERIADFETIRACKDGSLVDVSLTISPIKNRDGTVVGASTIARDTGERKRAADALRLSEQSYRLLFDHHPAPMWLFDPESLGFLAVNEAAINLYGYSREEFLAMTIDEIRPDEDRDALREALADPTRGYVEPNVWRHRRKDGTLIDVAVSSNALQFEGHPARLVLARDVTEQRQLEEQLRQAQKMEAIGRLAGGIAHDFNNLLLVIRGYSAVLLRRSDDEELRDGVEQIDGAALRASEFTKQLLAFSRQQVLRLEVTDLNSVVEETLRLLKRTIGEQIAVETSLDPDVGSILVDRSQLTQAVLNLSINARDAMIGDGGGTLSIRTANADLDDAYAAAHEGVAPGSYALLQITDSGPGMDEETQRRAFDPFFTTKEDGTGLGLATVYGLVKQSSGHIWLYSEPGMGTTFKLYLPTTTAPVIASTGPAEVSSLEGTETILLVEDTEMVRSLVTSTLESYGYKVLVAAGGQEALSLAEHAGGSIDLLLTDVVMPGMNGRELADALVAKYPALKVLFTSGYPSDTVVRHGIADARAAFIEKPYLPDDLARKLRQLLDQQAD
jgi:PAS domain S-box-containing protein